MLVDYHIHALGHQGGSYNEELLEQYCATACSQGLAEIGFADHDDYFEGVDEEEIRKVSKSSLRLQVKLGLEVSYWPGREKEIAKFAKAKHFDYLIGSIHHIGSWMFDHPDYISEYREWELSDLYRTYFQLVEKLARSRLFDIVGHLDLIKVFGYRVCGNIVSFAEPALRAIKDNGLTFEVNTSGLRKPCREMYPSRELVERCFELGIPVTLGSDAHQSSDVGRDLAHARELLYQVGYRKIAVFTRRQRDLVDL
ncbi:MAG: Histidinol phosphate phosphatase HisJ [Thermoanaerobacterales bacterium 50_218]|nr:MAG: Histidinol phosphate phosphatase HisJ [Thermoanaerobacterales bacterium 50_218]HAA90340.1 histidinol phosphate phosphatase [Peptococcaceae bacterium]